MAFYSLRSNIHKPQKLHLGILNRIYLHVPIKLFNKTQVNFLKYLPINAYLRDGRYNTQRRV